MEISFKDFRRFHVPAPVRIAPITVLLGENSSGKSSFAAGLRYILDCLSLGGSGSFNREPFYLGAYDQIAHYRGGKFGRASGFELGVHFDAEDISLLQKGAMIRQANSTEISINFEFENVTSQPSLCKISISNPYLRILMERPKLPRFKIAIGGGEFEECEAASQFSLPTTASMSDRNSFVSFMSVLQNAIYGRASELGTEKFQRLHNAVTKGTMPWNLLPINAVYASAPFRTKPERTYSPVEAISSSEGTHIPILLSQAKAFDRETWSRVKTKLEEFGKKSGMFRKIDVKRLGNQQSDPFQIIVEVSKDRSNLVDVGYGISQVVPLLVETIINRQTKFFVFQQPEVHLHPRAQSELGSYFLEIAQSTQRYVILETHSDFILDRIKADIIKQKKPIGDLLSVIYFERNSLQTDMSEIKFDQQGNVLSAPEGYRQFFVDEATRTLGFDV